MEAPSFKHKLFNSKILFVICLFILFFFSINLVREVVNQRALNKEISDLKEQMNALDKDNAELTLLIEKLKNLTFIEEEARTKLSLKKPGENILIVAENSVNGQNALLPLVSFENNINQAETNPQKWWNYFFSNNLNL